MQSSNSLGIQSTPNGATINNVPIYTMVIEPIEINDEVYELTDEKHKVLSSTVYSGKIMKKNIFYCWLISKFSWNIQVLKKELQNIKLFFQRFGP